MTFPNAVLSSVILSMAVASSVLAQTAAKPKAAAPAKDAPVAKAPDDKDLQWGPGPAFMPQGTEMTVLHGNPSKKNADVLLRVPAGAMIPDHTHTSAERMILVSGELHVTYTGQTAPMVMKAGGYGYGPAKLAHQATCASTVPCVLFIAFEGPVDALPTAAVKKSK